MNRNATVSNEHLAWCQHTGLRASTIDQRRWHIKNLAAGLARLEPPVDLLDVDATSIRAWQTDLTTRPQARASSVKHARAFYRWASDLDLIDSRILRHLVAPKLPARLPRPIPTADLHTALASAPDRIRPWLLLAAFCGLRACEVAPLAAEDLDLSSDPPRLLVADGKGGKQRVIPLAPLLVNELRSLAGRGHLFPAKTRMGENIPRSHVSASQVSHLASKYLHETGSASSFHALRHRFGTDAWAESLDLRLVQDLLGHASPRTTAGYVAIVPGRAAAVLNQMAEAYMPNRPRQSLAA